MRKTIALAVLLCLMMTSTALAGSISGEAFEEAQYIPTLLETITSYSYTLYEYDDEGNLNYANAFWFGKAEDGSIVVYEVDSDGNCTYTANGISVFRGADDNCKVLVYTQSAYESKMEDLFCLTMIYLGDVLVPYQTENGDMAYSYSDSEMSELCVFDANSLRMISFLSNQIVDGVTILAEQFIAQVDSPLMLQDRLREVLDGRTRNVVIHFQDGERMEYTVPADVTMYLFDDEDYALLSLDADMTMPIGCLLPGFDAEVWSYSPAE